MPFGTFGILFHGVVNLSRIASLPSSPGWDQESAQKAADLDEVASEIKRKLVALHSSLCDLSRTGEDPNPWEFLCKLMDSMLSWHKKFASGSMESESLQAKSAKLGGLPSTCDDLRAEGLQGSFDGWSNQQLESSSMPAGSFAQSDPSEFPPSQWDEMLWQATLDEMVSLYAPMQAGTNSGGAFAPWSYP